MISCPTCRALPIFPGRPFLGSYYWYCECQNLQIENTEKGIWAVNMAAGRINYYPSSSVYVHVEVRRGRRARYIWSTGDSIEGIPWAFLSEALEHMTMEAADVRKVMDS
jgi:hypothetical protein